MIDIAMLYINALALFVIVMLGGLLIAIASKIVQALYYVSRVDVKPEKRKRKGKAKRGDYLTLYDEFYACVAVSETPEELAERLTHLSHKVQMLDDDLIVFDYEYHQARDVDAMSRNRERVYLERTLIKFDEPDIHNEILSRHAYDLQAQRESETARPVSIRIPKTTEVIR